MSKRFIVEEDNITKQEENIFVVGEEVHHLNVLRYKNGDTVYINEYEIEITNLLKDKLEGRVIGKMPIKGVPNVNITLIQSYLKSDKTDYVVQKAVELGVKEITPILTKNTVVKLDEKDKLKKQERLNKIAKEAVEQCGRGDMVKVNQITTLKQINWSSFDYILVCHETSKVDLKEKLSSIKEMKNIAVLIGPEGGLDDSEIQDILGLSNCTDISLGERVLRAETASFAILSILDYELN